MTRVSTRNGGFTLLEIMIAVSILAFALSWMIEATTRAIVAENHAKLVTTATFLARAQMVELEEKLQEKGLADEAFSSEKAGDFEEEGFKRFHWHQLVSKIELPGADVLQTAISSVTGGNGDNKGSSVGGFSSGTSGGNPSTNLFASQFGLIKEIMEGGIRKVKVWVTWTENGNEQKVEVQEFLTDPRRVDQTVAMPTIGMPGAPGTPGAAGTPGAPVVPGGPLSPPPSR